MTLEQAKQYDELLSQLKTDGKQTEIRVPRNNVLYGKWYFLKSLDLVELIITGGGIAMARLTSKGITFVGSTSFEVRHLAEQQEEEDKRLQRINWEESTKSSRSAVIMARWSIAISILAVLAAFAGYIERLIAWLFF